MAPGGRGDNGQASSALAPSPPRGADCLSLRGRRLMGSIFFSSYPETRVYRDLTLLTIAKAIGAKAGRTNYRATVVIDGLRRAEERIVGVGLRRLRVRIRRIRGAREESDPLVRLADAMAGFIRDAEEGNSELRERS